MKIKYFEGIDCNNFEDYYSKELKFDSKNIKVDLNFETKSIFIRDITLSK